MAAKKDIRQRLRASVEAEDKAVRQRLPGKKQILDHTMAPIAEGDTVQSPSTPPEGIRNRIAKPADPILPEDHATVVLLRERLLSLGYSLSSEEILRAGMYALLDAPEALLREALDQLHKPHVRRPLFPSIRGRIQLSRDWRMTKRFHD